MTDARLKGAFEKWWAQHLDDGGSDQQFTGDAFAAGWIAAARVFFGIVQDHHDTVDGRDGTPHPNLAMHITTEAQQVFGELT